MGKVIELGIDNLIDAQMQYISIEYMHKDFQKCYDSCQYLLNLLPADEEAQKKVKRLCYTKQAVCLKKLERYDEALDKANIAEQYCSSDDYYNVVYMKVLIYKKLKENDKALERLDDCIGWYRTNSMYYELAKALDTKADLLKSEELFFEAIENYKIAEQEKNYLDEEKFKMDLDNVYQRLVELYLYIGEQNLIKSYATLNNIRNKGIKDETKEMIKTLYRKEV